MPSTKYKIAEQVKFMLEAGSNKQSAKFKMDDIMELAGQVINKLLRTTHFAVTMQQDGQKNRIPDGAMMATYENIPVTTYHGRSRDILPAVPIQLPKDVGLFQVSAQGDCSCDYIPVPSGQ